MGKNIKFIIPFVGLFLSSCGLQEEVPSSSTSYGPFSDNTSEHKYNSIYNKIVLELLLHKDQHHDALNHFVSNIKFFKNESDFISMVNRARDLRRFNDITKITNSWLKLNPLSISAHKISFSNNIEISDFKKANIHLEYLFEMHKEKNNKSYIDLEDILSRNIIINNIVKYFEDNLNYLDNEDLLLSYINVLQDNDLDSIAVSYLKKMRYENNRSLARKYSSSLAKLSNIDKSILILESYLNSSAVTDREAYFDLLGLYLLKKDQTKVNDLIDKLISIDPSDDDFIFRVALLCFDKGELRLSEKYFNILLSKSYAPDNINFFLGQIDYNNQRYDEALLHYERIRQGTFVNTKLLNVAKALVKKYDLDRALSYLDQEIKIKTNEDYLNLLFLKLSLYKEPYDINMVIEISSEILTMFPENERALYSRALANEKKGDISSMSQDFERMIQTNPYNSIALNAYGYSLSLHKKRLSYAEELIRRAINVDPGNAAILDSLAWVLYLNGSYKDAYDYASLAYTKDKDPEIVSHYYKILLKNGFVEKAEQILKQAVSDNPDSDILLKLIDTNQNEAAQM